MAARMSGWKRALIVIPAVGVCVAGLAGGAAIGKRIAGGERSPEDYAFFDEVTEVKHLLSQRFVDVPDDEKLREGAIKGMVEALGDPYTVYVPAAGTRNFTKDLTGEYVGIGAQINKPEGYLIIVTPLEDSPAYRAGLMADDRVVEINGTSTLGLDVDGCIDLLMGEPGTKVKLLIDRKGEKFETEITRERIKARAVKGVHRTTQDPNTWDFMIDPGRQIAYVRLNQFTPECAEEVAGALRSAGAETGGVKGLVLDLRFNPGGLLKEAEEIADMFLDSGVIVSTKGRAYEEVVRHAEKPGTFPNFPIAILLNGQSASASEILAGALVENDRAIAVGTRSFGKGSVQSVIALNAGKGSELKLTEQGYYLPSGRSITRKDDTPTWGVDPTDGFYVPMSDEDVIAMIDVRRKNEALHAQGNVPAETENWEDPEWVLRTLKDPQLVAAVHAVQAKVDTGEWKTTGQNGPQGVAVASGELTALTQLRVRLERELERTDKRIDSIVNAEPTAADARKDFWADDLDLKGGVLEVRDKDGKVVATLDITGNNLERWLIDADVKKK
ncbi:carboxyl-terminal processing protease [Phycisphaerales bacterium]|nr:carboxyl-terminal processing protease [Phycisphaerales bacterium]